MLLLMQDDNFGLCKIYNFKVTSNLNLVFYIFTGWEFIKYFILCQQVYKNILICDSDDHNAKHVYASKDTQAKFQTRMFNIIKVFTQS